MDITVIATERLDAHMQGVLLRPDSMARKVVQSMIAVSGGGTGDGGSVVVGESPIRVTDNGDGTAWLEVLTAGATLTPSADGTYVVLEFTGGSA